MSRGGFGRDGGFGGRDSYGGTGFRRGSGRDYDGRRDDRGYNDRRDSRGGGGDRRDSRGGGPRGGRGGRGGSGGGSQTNIYREKGQDYEESRSFGRERDYRRGRRGSSSSSDGSPPPVLERRKPTLWDSRQLPEQIHVPIIGGSHNPNLMRQQRRLYVGNLPPTISEIELMEFFNNTMINSGAITAKGSPVVSAHINSEKAYAFVEFRSGEEASIGMGLDGVSLQGNQLRVRRTKDYQGDEHGHQMSSANETPNKILITGLPTSLNEAEVKKILLTFGQLKTFNLVRDSLTGLSKGFAFCEFSDPAVTDGACNSLREMVIDGNNLVVQRSTTTANLRNMGEDTVLVDPRAAAMLTLSSPAAQLLSTACPSATPEPTRVLVLMNIVNITDFPGDKVDEEYDELWNDLMNECVRYGPVKKLLVPRPAKKIIHDTVEFFHFDQWKDDEDTLEMSSEDDEGAYVPGLGKVFVEYESIFSAKKAQTSLSGRRYDGRMVITSFFPEDKWARGELEPDSLPEQELTRMPRADLSAYMIE